MCTSPKLREVGAQLRVRVVAVFPMRPETASLPLMESVALMFGRSCFVCGFARTYLCESDTNARNKHNSFVV